MRADVRVEPSDCAGRAYSSDQVLVLEKLKSAIDRCLRKTRELFAQSAVDGFDCRVREIFGQRSIDGQALRGDSNAARPALPLEIRAPAVDFGSMSSCELVAVNSHVRIIIIWNDPRQVRLFKARERSGHRAFRVPTLVG